MVASPQQEEQHAQKLSAVAQPSVGKAEQMATMPTTTTATNTTDADRAKSKMMTIGRTPEGIVWGVDELTNRRRPAEGIERAIPSPGVPRATRAISCEKPEGSPNSANDKTVIQQHVDFWDRDKDGIIWPTDTFVGFRKLGFGYVISFLAACFINGTMSYATRPNWIPHPLFPVHVQRMHKCKHGNDTNTFDPEGRFVPLKFEEIFSKFDKNNKKALSRSDIMDMSRANVCAMDVYGFIAARLEWLFTWWIAKDEHGLVSKERVRSAFDGTLFPIIAEEVERKRALSSKKRTKKMDGAGAKFEELTAAAGAKMKEK